MAARAAYPEIGDLAVIGDGRATALIGRNGTVAWMAMPEDDRIAIFSSLLDAAGGGRLDLAPNDDHEVEREYVANTAVLRTTFRTERGSAEVLDCLALHNGAVLPWVELTRRIRLLEGEIDLSWRFRSTGHLGAEPAEFAEHHGLLQCRIDDLALAYLHFCASEVEVDETSIRGRIRLDAGHADALLTAICVVGEPLVRPDRSELEARVDRTVQTWQTWSKGIEFEGRFAGEVRRSAQMLKLLLQHRTGAPIAAATTSLPEHIGGNRNYDYRFCWIRDASFTVDALLTIGLVEKAHRAIVALLRMAATTEPDLAPLYTILGEVPSGSEVLDLPGYRGSRPVHRGNDATDQLQLGTWGDLFDSLWRYVERGNDLDPGSGALLAALADRLCDRWREADAGIWERTERAQYTFSKLGAWTALDRVLRLVDADQLDGDADRWRHERDEVRRFIERRCWSTTRQTFTFTADDDRTIDAACLLAGRMGFASDEQLAGTVEAVRAELADGPFVWRYSGMREREGAFLACSFWLVDALARLERTDEAEDVFRGALGAMNDVGVLSEEYDPRSGSSLGNVPQGLSHLSLINAAAVLEDLHGRRRRDPGVRLD